MVAPCYTTKFFAAHFLLEQSDSVGRGCLVDRLTKTVVLASTVGALAFETVNVGRDLWYLPWLALAAAVVAYGAGRAHPERTAGVILAAGAVTPVLFILTTGHFRLWFLFL